MAAVTGTLGVKKGQDGKYTSDKNEIKKRLRYYLNSTERGKNQAAGLKGTS
jgi:spore maturation protein CgeB